MGDEKFNRQKVDESLYVKKFDPQQKTLKAAPPAKDDKELEKLNKFLFGYGNGWSASAVDENDNHTGKTSTELFIGMMTPEFLSRKIRMAGPDGKEKETTVVSYLLRRPNLYPDYTKAVIEILDRSNLSPELKKEIINTPAADGTMPLARVLAMRNYKAAKQFILAGSTLENLKTSSSNNDFGDKMHTFERENMFHLIARNGSLMPDDFVQFLKEQDKKSDGKIAGLLSRLNFDATEKGDSHTPYHLAVPSNPALLEQFMALDNGDGAKVFGRVLVKRRNGGSGGGGSAVNAMASGVAEAYDCKRPGPLVICGITAYGTNNNWNEEAAKFLLKHDFLGMDPDWERGPGHVLTNVLHEKWVRDPDKLDKTLDECFDLFVKFEHLDISTDAKKQKARTNFMNYALRSAVTTNNPVLTAALLEKGAMDFEPPYKTVALENTRTAIHEAVRHGNADIVRQLIEADARPKVLPAGKKKPNPADAFTWRGDLTMYDMVKTAYEKANPGKKLKSTLDAEAEYNFLRYLETTDSGPLIIRMIRDDFLQCRDEDTLALVRAKYESCRKKMGPALKPEDREAVEKWIHKKEEEFAPAEKESGKETGMLAPAPRDALASVIALDTLVEEASLGKLLPQAPAQKPAALPLKTVAIS